MFVDKSKYEMLEGLIWWIFGPIHRAFGRSNYLGG